MSIDAVRERPGYEKHPAGGGFDFDDPPSDPIRVLQTWIDAARDATDLPNPNAMSVATVDPDGRPSSRIVLLKEIEPGAIVFYTNRGSRKGKALAAHPYVCCVLHWDPLDRQVVIEGDVEEVDDAQSDRYFHSRRRESRIGAWASDQSAPCASRAELDAAVAEVEARFEGKETIPRPPHWGGYRVRVTAITFWSGHPHRLHDRVEYRREGDGWRAQRLWP